MDLWRCGSWNPNTKAIVIGWLPAQHSMRMRLAASNGIMGERQFLPRPNIYYRDSNAGGFKIRLTPSRTPTARSRLLGPVYFWASKDSRRIN
jgi:hypothetical protein